MMKDKWFIRSIILIRVSKLEFSEQIQHNTMTSLAIQWLRLQAFIAGATSLLPGWGTKIPIHHVAPPKIFF